MAKQRIKQAAIEAAQDKTEVTAHIRAIGDLNREIKRLETEAGDKKAVIEEEYAALAAPLKAESERLTAAVAAYCEAHKDELTENGKTKTVDFTTSAIRQGNRRRRRLGLDVGKNGISKLYPHQAGNRQRCHSE